MLPGYPAGVAATSPPYPTPGGAIPWGDPARNCRKVAVDADKHEGGRSHGRGRNGGTKGRRSWILWIIATAQGKI